MYFLSYAKNIHLNVNNQKVQFTFNANMSDILFHLSFWDRRRELASEAGLLTLL